jgi:hypothetical protein
VGRRRARRGARGGEDIQAPRASGTRVATGLSAVASLLAVAAVPLARGDETFQAVDVRVAAFAFLALVAAVVRGWSALVPVSVTIVGGMYAAGLAIDDAALDLAAPAVAVGLYLAAELGYWSLDERTRSVGDPGLGLRRAALVAAEGLAIFVVATALLVVVDEVRARSLALDLAGALAAVGVLAAVLATGRSQSSRGS